MKKGWVAVLLLAGVLAAASPVSGQVREQRPNLVGGELLGRGIALTLNYERFFTNTFGIGAGLMAVGVNDGWVGIIPLYGSFVFGDTHAFYLSGGTTLLIGDESIDDDFQSDAAASIAFGYQYQSSGGFFVRPLFTVLFDSDYFILWPGITIGGSF
jgi:hypothetical protein